ncbi:Integrase zinc binding domain [Popillia japonica]|uniref:RNA-directed DNA polymerase n=1 Tax=Popillia japonica TaxID=7064 RepID=A0AAW1J0G0_POPJA
MLKLMHESHMGITKTIKRAKCNLYWPNMAQDIENEIRKCKICEKFQRRNIKEPMKPHKIPGLPFEKIATDILEFGGIDYFSKWLDILMLKRKTSDDVIDEFKRIFDLMINAKSRAEFKRGEDVVLRKEKEWVPAKIEEKLDYPRSYLVKDEDGKVYRRNSVFLRKSVNRPNFRGIDKELEEAGKKGEEQVDDRDQEEVNKEIANQRQEIEVENRGEREKRERKLPSRFKDYKLY